VTISESRANDLTLQAALDYARADHEVFPLAPRRKVPTTKHGHLDASTDVAEIAGWWDKHPRHLVGLRPAQGECVIDVEGPHGDHATSGLSALAELEAKHGSLVGYPRASTPSGGLHIWASHGMAPEEIAAHPAAGIDVKAHSGFVVAPPAAGRQWLTPLVGSPPRLPKAWQDWMRKPKPKAKAQRATEPVGGDGQDVYTNKAVRDELDELENTPRSDGRHGGRNKALYAKAARLDELGVQRDWARTNLLYRCNHNGLLADDGEKTCNRTIESAHAKVGGNGSYIPDLSNLRNAGESSDSRSGRALRVVTGSATTEHAKSGESGADKASGSATQFKTPKVWKASELRSAAQPRWLAKRWIPRAAPTVFCGDEGIGKSLWDMRIVAAVTTGTALPDIAMPERDPMRVLLAAITEEDWSSIVLPRLVVAGADLDMIDVICTDEDGSGPPVFPRDFDLIRAMRPKSGLVVVDSWLDTLAMGTVVRDSQSSATALAPWTDLATTTEAGIILLTPTNRMGTGDIREKYGVTQHLRKKARSTIFAIRDDDTDFLVLGPDKANNTKPDLANMYRIEAVQHWEPTEDDDGTVGRIEYVATTDRTIREWVGDKHEDADDLSEVDKAAVWLGDYLLREQPALHDNVKEAADAEGIKPRTLRRARLRLKVEIEAVKGVTPFTTTWRLPT
jgi:Bifunctional DNA primase/polymerase, N-terminal/AAA domain